MNVSVTFLWIECTRLSTGLLLFSLSSSVTDFHFTAVSRDLDILSSGAQNRLNRCFWHFVYCLTHSDMLWEVKLGFSVAPGGVAWKMGSAVTAIIRDFHPVHIKGSQAHSVAMCSCQALQLEPYSSDLQRQNIQHRCVNRKHCYVYPNS